MDGIEMVEGPVAPPWLISGESVQLCDRNVGCLAPQGRHEGLAYVTNYRFRFENSASMHDCKKTFVAEVPLGLVFRVDKVGGQLNNKSDIYGLQILCKDNRAIRLFSDPSVHGRRALYECLQRVAFPLSSGRFSRLFAESFFSAGGASLFSIDGWQVFNPQREFSRMRIPSEWVISEININYDLADTYPKYVVIPKQAHERGTSFIRKVAEFRSRQRFAVLSWLNRTTGASITRCAQPLTGMTYRKCTEDEEYMKMIMAANLSGHQLFIFDARPVINANVNRAKGGGHEEEYDRCSLHFLNIQNIHAVRESLSKLMESLYPRVDEKNYLKAVEESRWLSHIHSIIHGANQVVQALQKERCSALVHCSDGWDRTAQLTALAMLQLDGYYRTIEGFAVLIEKEWCSFGHKFSQRCRHGVDVTGDNERSPIFVQFFDCVWQILKQYECYFEFTSELLRVILDELYTCRFGTFLYDSEKERLKIHSCSSTTVSLWSYILSRRQDFLNPFFISTTPHFESFSPRPQIWTEYYGQHNDAILSPSSIAARRAALSRGCGRRALLDEMVLTEEQLSSRSHHLTSV